ncbi:MAG: endolytic transglycosylase MltG, partial [Reyranellales bacterium]
MIEKETAIAAERAKIAAVFINRLRRKMKLESDPTTIYGLTGGKSLLGRELTRADLQSTSPYNTYTAAGLPPGPICNPGRASILAATNPARERSIYFVADGQGGHVFAVTVAEHNRNVEHWKDAQRRRQEQQATPAPNPATAPPPAPARP